MQRKIITTRHAQALLSRRNNWGRSFTTTNVAKQSVVVHENKFYSGEHPFNLVVLNTPYCTYPLFPKLYNLAKTVVCADGGANQVYESFHERGIAIRPPDYICGDLDSAKASVLNYFKSQSTTVVHVTEQDTNDLQKSLNLLSRLGGSSQLTTTVIYGAGGRLDQEMCNLNSLFDYSGSGRCVIISPFSCATILKPGKHVIKLNPDFEKTTCAIVPLGKPCRTLTTSGLRWNINHQNPDFPALSFGGLVSTSNEFEGNEVHLENSDEVLWIWVLKKHTGRI